MKPLRRFRDHLRRNAYGLWRSSSRSAVAPSRAGIYEIDAADQGFVPAARYQDVSGSNCTNEPLIPTGGSLVLHWGHAFFRTGGVKDASCRTGYREIQIEVDGDPIAKSVQPPAADNDTAQTVSTLADLSTNDRVTLVASHNADAALAPRNDSRTFFSFHWVGARPRRPRGLTVAAGQRGRR